MNANPRAIRVQLDLAWEDVQQGVSAKRSTIRVQSEPHASVGWIEDGHGSFDLWNNPLCGYQQ